MAIAFVNGKNSTVASTASITLNIGAVTAGNCLILQVVGNQTVSSVSDTAGNTWGSGTSDAATGGWPVARYYVVPNCLGNANDTVTVTMSSANFCNACVMQYSGVATTSPVDVTVSNSSGATNVTTQTSPSFTPTTSTGVAVAFGANANNGVNYTAGTNYTLRTSQAGVIQVAGEDRLNAPASSQTASITVSVADSVDIFVIVLKAPAALTTNYVRTPDQVVRQPIYRSNWFPEKTQTFTPTGPASQIVIVPRDPIPPELPGRFTRFNWNPDKTWILRAAISPGNFVIPTNPIPPTLPERFMRPIWNPDHTEWHTAVGKGNVQIFPEDALPIPPCLPIHWARPTWNPQHTDVETIPRPPGLVVIVPQDPIPASLPDRYLRPLWNPERTGVKWIIGGGLPSALNLTAAVDPSSVEINERFLVTVTATVASFGDMGGPFIPVIVAEVNPQSAPQTAHFDGVYCKDIAGFGYMSVPTQPVILSSGTVTNFYYEGVAFKAGTYTLTAALVGRNGVYYISSAVSLTVNDPQYTGTD